MALVNRDKDASEQIYVMQAGPFALGVGASAAIAHYVAEIPNPGTLKQVAIAARSISGAPILDVEVRRFTGSGGATVITFVGATLAPVQAGISGYATQMFSVTSFALQAGDVVMVNCAFGAGNVCADGSVVSVVVQAAQDIKSYFGTSYSNT